jgi:hypothetical protein
MEAKEKAIELVGKFYLQTEYYMDLGCEELAKDNALICVDEIISNGGTKNVIQYEPNCFTNGIEYWQEVKQEINKL